jgi:Ca2+-binding EF-hand superfamily protein
MFKRFVYLLATAALATFAQGANLETVRADDADKDAVAKDQPPKDTGAKGTAPDNEALFKQLDKNSDGQIADDEIPQDKQRLLKRLMRNADKDGNGKLSREELVVGLKGRDRQQSELGKPEPGAASDGSSVVETFRERDRDGDGKITVDDVPPPLRERFAGMLERADKDGDKGISLEEFKKAEALGQRLGRPDGPPPGAPNGPPPGGDVLFRTLDADRDGALSGDELAQAADALKKLDKDGDGKVTRRELLPPREGGGPEGSDRPAPEQLIRRLMAGDKNNDGKLSREELPQRLQRDFELLDANGDASVSADELKTGLERLREGGGGRGAEALKKRLEKANGKMQ